MNLNFTWGKQVYARNRLVSDSNLSLNGIAVDALESGAVVQNSLVGGTDRQFDSVQLGNHREVAALVREHLHAHVESRLLQHINYL